MIRDGPIPLRPQRIAVSLQKAVTQSFSRLIQSLKYTYDLAVLLSNLILQSEDMVELLLRLGTKALYCIHFPLYAACHKAEAGGPTDLLKRSLPTRVLGIKHSDLLFNRGSSRGQ
ncbi:MAG TPA: hypothetical protein VJV96_12450 [Candidatus Angelobacter sp.]|nr:hypothetical protein [Candidatus Angelobacter sp.]